VSSNWALWHADGPAEYDADHYDWLSNRYDAGEPAKDVGRCSEAGVSTSPVPRDVTAAERALLDELRQVPA